MLTKIARIDQENPERINEVEENVIIGLMPRNAIYDHLNDDLILEYFQDERIALVTVLVLVDDGVTCYISDNKMNQPIFFRKIKDMNVTGNVKSENIARAFIANGMYIEDIAEPLIRVNNDYTIY